MSGPRTEPIDIEKVGDDAIAILWADGHRSTYGFDYLRGQCPCAGCSTHRRDRSPLKILSNAPLMPLRLSSIEPTGRYALCFVWSDGHSQGIFSYDFLREICPCEECAAGGAASAAAGR